ESSIGAARATKQPPALKAGTQEIRSARRAAAVIPLYGLTSAADRVKSEMARPSGVDVPMRLSSWFNHGKHKQHKSRQQYRVKSYEEASLLFISITWNSVVF